MCVFCVELDVAKDTSSDAAVSRAGFDTLMMPSSSSSSSSFFGGATQHHVTSLSSCRPASLATQFAQPPNYDKNMNIQPIRAHCNGACRNVPIPAHQPPALPACRPVLSPVMDKPTVPCHGWTPPGCPGNPRQYPGPCDIAGGGESCVVGPSGPCSAAIPASPYPSPPLSTRSGADLRWSPVSQLGADDSWPCGDLPAKNQLRSSLPVDLVGPGDMLADFDLTQNSGRQSALTTYTGIRS